MNTSFYGREVTSAPLLLALCFGSVCLGQESLGTAGSSSDQPVAATAVRAKDAETPAWRNSLDRWLQVNDLSYSMRYRSVFDSNNAHSYDQGQQRSLIDGNLKLDSEGKYGVTFHLSSGNYFNWAYADFIGGGGTNAVALTSVKFTPIQSGYLTYRFLTDPIFQKGLSSSGGWGLRMRRLYGHAEPIKGIELQYGSLDLNRGSGSEITTYDNDGYIAGERLIIRKPSYLFFDEASITYGYFGDVFTANFFERGDRLAKSNYHQFLLGKHFAKRLEASVDYTWEIGSNTIREAAAADIKESKILDRVRFESYQRFWKTFYQGSNYSVAGGNGFAVTLDKKLTRRFSMEAGVANIDPRYTVLTQKASSSLFSFAVNGDQYGLGNRFFVRPTIALTPYLDITGFYTKAYQPLPDPILLFWNKQALNAGINLDIKKFLLPKSEKQ